MGSPLPRLSPRHRDKSRSSCQDVISVGWNQISSQDLGQWWVPGDPLKPVWFELSNRICLWGLYLVMRRPWVITVHSAHTPVLWLKKKKKKLKYSWAEHFRICQILGGFRISLWIFQSFLLEKTRTVVKRIGARDPSSGATSQLTGKILSSFSANLRLSFHFL